MTITRLSEVMNVNKRKAERQTNVKQNVKQKENKCKQINNNNNNNNQTNKILLLTEIVKVPQTQY